MRPTAGSKCPSAALARTLPGTIGGFFVRPRGSAEGGGVGGRTRRPRTREARARREARDPEEGMGIPFGMGIVPFGMAIVPFGILWGTFVSLRNFQEH